MGYKIVKQPQAWWPVEFDGITEEGEPVRNRFELRFRLFKVDAAANLITDAMGAVAGDRRAAQDAVDEELDSAAAKQEAAKASQIYASFVARIATDWRGVEFENGEPMRFDGDKWVEALADADRKRAAGEDAPEFPVPESGGDNLRALMDEPGMFSHVLAAFKDCIAGKPKAREGN